jgi:hypothetical protein
MAQNTVTTKLLLDSSQFQAGMQKATSKTKNFSQSMFRLGRDLSASLTLPLALAAKNIIDTAQSFDLAQRKIAALSGQTQIFENLSSSARELGASTIFTATEVSELQLALKKLGLESKTIEGVQETVLQFAQAMDTDLADSGEFLIQTINRFSDSLEDMGDKSQQIQFVGDLFATAAANSAVDAEKLRAALNYVGAEAAAAGFRLEETTAIIALLADRGFDASRGGTALRRILAQLAKDGFTAEESLSALFDSTKSYSEELKQFGLRGAGPKATLGGLNVEFAMLLETLRNSDGFLEDVADVMDTSLYASLKKVQSAAKEFSISMGDDIQSPLKNFLALIADIIRKLSTLPAPVKKVLVALGSFLAILGPIALGIGAVGLAFQVLGGTLLANPIFAALAGVIALGTALAATAYDAEQLAKAAEDNTKSIEKFAGVSEAALKKARVGEEAQKRAAQLLKQREGLLTRINNLQNNLNSYQIADERRGEGISKNTQKTAEALEKARDLLREKNEELDDLIGRAKDWQDLWSEEAIGPEIPDWVKELNGGADPDFKYTPVDPEFIYSQWLAAKRNIIKDAEAASDEIDLLRSLKAFEWDFFIEDAQKAIDQIDTSWWDDEEEAEIVDEFTSMTDEMQKKWIEFAEFTRNKTEIWGAQLRDTITSVGEAFSDFFYDGITQSKTWAQSFKDNILDALGAIIKKVIALTIAWGILSIVSGGAMGAGLGSLATEALRGQNLTQFIGSGFGFDSVVSPLRSTNIRGAVAGSDLVFTTQRGINANYRIYG